MSLIPTHISLIRQTFDAIGAKLPKGVSKALEDRDALTGYALPIPSPEQIADAMAECILNGRDPLDDDQVRRMAIAQSLAGARGQSLTHRVQQASDRRVVAALVDDVDAVLAPMRRAVASLGEALTEAFAVLGDLDLKDSAAVLSLGPEAARRWVTARDAVDQVHKIGSAWASLAELTRFAPTQTDSAIRLASLDLETFEKVGRGGDAWALVRAGATLDLADGDTIRERVSALEQARQHRHDAAQREFTDNFRRLRGAGIA